MTKIASGFVSVDSALVATVVKGKSSGWAGEIASVFPSSSGAMSFEYQEEIEATHTIYLFEGNEIYRSTEKQTVSISGVSINPPCENCVRLSRLRDRDRRYARLVYSNLSRSLDVSSLQIELLSEEIDEKEFQERMAEVFASCPEQPDSETILDQAAWLSGVLNNFQLDAHTMSQALSIDADEIEGALKSVEKSFGSVGACKCLK